jgi:hypothetical protein
MAYQQMPNSAIVAGLLGYAYGVSGNVAQAHKILHELTEEYTRYSFPPIAIASVYIGLGDKDLAFKWLGEAVDGKDVNLNLLVDPIYDSLRSDSRFAQLLRRAGLS